MNIQEQLTFELGRRAALLPGEVESLKELADKNRNGWGIHQSQIHRVKEILDGLQLGQEQVLEGLNSSLPLDAFAHRRTAIEQMLTGTHSIMATFNYIFDQRFKSPDYKLVLDIADIIAAKCYLPCIQLANKWRGKPAGHFREPPLIYFNAMLAPAAITRSRALNKVGIEMYAEVERQLPISIISLPFHDKVAIWTFCSLYHEVGHLLDNDIGLRSDMKESLGRALSKSDRRESWQHWTGEMLADTFGVLLGGAAFGHALTAMLHKSGKDVRTITVDTHTNDYVRILLLCALLRETKARPLADAANDIEQNWFDTYGAPGELQPYADECETVAHTLLYEKLDALKNEKLLIVKDEASLIGLAPTLLEDHEDVLKLSRWLRNVDERPNPMTYPLRLVPAAAQLAVHDVKMNFEAKYDSIHKRTLDYIGEIEPPNFLDASLETDEHKSFVKEMIKNINFSALKIEQA